VVGLDNQIKATHNLVVRPQKLLKEVKLDEFSAFCMPGGFHARGFMQAYNDEVLAAIKYIHKNGGIIATICTAALPVAKTGLLKGKKVTTYPLTPEVTDRDNLAILKEYGACFVKEEIVVDNRIITSSGPGTCYKVAFKLLELL
jgi:4-methyl-5(b-hydroxyethyl)-thiazole monophosphate biosynthesis